MKVIKKKLKSKSKHVCVACKQSFPYNCLLTYHIRRHHFNLIGFVPHSETQNVNQVWFEKVADTNILVEMRKISANVLLIQKLKDDTTILPTEINHEVIDLREQYQCNSGGTKTILECRVCQMSFGKRELTKHFAASHAALVKKACDDCGSSFKQLINCVTHICPNAGINKKPKKQNDELVIVDSKEAQPSTTSEPHPSTSSEPDPPTPSELHSPTTTEPRTPTPSELHPPPSEPHTPTQSEPHAPPSEPHPPTPLEPHTPTPLEPHTPTPLEPHTPTPLEPHTPTPSESHPPTPSELL